MRATEWRDSRNYNFLTRKRNALLFALILLLCSFGCAPSSPQGDGKQSPAASASNELPEITEEIIHREINGARVRQVPEENGTAEPISWTFDEEEPKEITVVDKQMEGESATIVFDIKTKSAPDAREPRYLAGQIRTKWELQTGWVLRKWEIVRTENISMKYRNLPKPPAQNANNRNENNQNASGQNVNNQNSNNQNSNGRSSNR